MLIIDLPKLQNGLQKNLKLDGWELTSFRVAGGLYNQMGKILWSCATNGGSLIIQTETLILQKGLTYGGKLTNGNESLLIFGLSSRTWLWSPRIYEASPSLNWLTRRLVWWSICFRLNKYKMIV